MGLCGLKIKHGKPAYVAYILFMIRALNWGSDLYTEQQFI